MEQMPLKTVGELEAECLRLLQANMTTREISANDPPSTWWPGER